VREKEERGYGKRSSQKPTLDINKHVDHRCGIAKLVRLPVNQAAIPTCQDDDSENFHDQTSIVSARFALVHQGDEHRTRQREFASVTG
jgi:hypothetical protein